MVTYVASHPNSALVLQRLWPLNRALLLRAMVALYDKDASNVARVLDVCQVGGRAGCEGRDGCSAHAADALPTSGAPSRSPPHPLPHLTCAGA